jgi:hypothetical protein
MSKSGVTMVASLVLASFMLGIVGCKPLNPAQIKVVAKNAGLYSAVGWIALDNPSADEINAVKSILVIIEEKAADVQGGSTYTEVLQPEIFKYIDEEVDARYQAVCKAGALSILGGIDMLFAANPSWTEDQDLVISVVDSFIVGAKVGLNMNAEHPVMKAARGTATARARVYKP